MSDFGSSNQPIGNILSDSVESFRDALLTAQHIIVVAGAGLSAASGIPTFRGAGGIWRSLDAIDLATPTAFAENPSLVWQFYHYRRVKALEATPNAAHHLLAKLTIPSVLKSIAPDFKTYNLITQNVDRLSTRAMESLLSSPSIQFEKRKNDIPTVNSGGSGGIIEMHGRLFDVRCSKSQEECDWVEEDLSNPLNVVLGMAGREAESYESAGSNSSEAVKNIPVEELPKCKKCGALARPGVVWFEEKPKHLDEINKLVDQADVCLVVGTSSTVFPAASYAYRVHKRGGTVAVFNLEESDGDDHANFVFYGPCETELPRVLGISTD
ncbi:DHS-like NAD/FAD-binding domain-containing protein [Pluteus cervinus]|uniref:DHS-like NAD/FAD-binding domain-containing protein n=1 Tax=Pluteus cervinus TaxID=181527 RepID=A0ACD3AKZ0_9AGAR|nr:DHS-like NAD/FAD-binding domain-containing protein [Pluteus cervinus]